MAEDAINKDAFGRPTLYTEELGKLICDRIATHPNGLIKICKMYNDLPSHDTVYKWIHRHPDFSDRYFKAKQAQMDMMIDNINDHMHDDLLHYTDSEGNKRIDSPSVTFAVAKAANNKWAASKLKPEIYGDKVQKQDTTSNSLVEKIIDKLG